MTADQYFLSKGAHNTASDGRCAMEWVAYLAGLEHTDQPVCVSPVLREFCINFNDSLPDDRRQRLRPYLGRCIGTNGDGRDEQRRWLATDWLIRTYVPAWLALTPSLVADADRLRSLPPVMAQEALTRAVVDLGEARKNAAAAGDAARAAAWDAAGDAAGDALQPTVDQLQDSALDLLDRMLPTEVIQLPVVEDAAQVCALPVG